MSSLKLFLFGSPRLERDGLPIKLDTRKNVALVAYLAMMEGHHSRETLVALLWPELAPARAHAVLRRNLSVLRKTLDGAWLVVDRESVGTDPRAGFWLDVARFHKLLQAPQEHGHTKHNTCPACLDTLAEAVELYRGDFMAGFGLPDSTAFDEWQFFQAEGLRRKLAAALERLVCGYSAHSECERAIPYARRWVALDPLHELAQCWLMRLYALSGQRAAALRQYHECARVLDAEMSLAPSTETTSLYEHIRAGQVGGAELSAPLASPRHNLPAQSTRFIGRQALLTAIEDRLQDPDGRALTLVGPGGSGKTRLALAAAAALLDRFGHGVFFVPLAPLQSVEAILPAVAQAVGFSFYGAAGGESEVAPRQQLLDYLRHKRMLLVLDNFEHLLDGVDLVTDILDTAPHVRVLATSRVRLNLQSEHLFPVAGLSLPDDAVELFVASARRVQPDFGLTTDNLAHVVRICRLVEGLPLGILLAAAWVRTLPPAEIVAQIAQGIDFLEADLRDLPTRQRSMRAVFDRSWALLTRREQAICQRVSIFCGGFTWQAARQVADASLHDLRTLVDKSLLHRTVMDRFEMHELLRQYAEERLDQEPVTSQAARGRHCAYYTSALQQWAMDLKGPRQQRALAEMDAEIENARMAWNWSVRQGQIERLDQAMEGLCLFCTWRSRYEEGKAVCRAVVEGLQSAHKGWQAAAPDDGPRVQARALMWQSVFERELGCTDLADQLLGQGRALIEELEFFHHDIRAERASLLRRMGEMAYRSDLREAERLFEQSLALYQVLGDRWGAANVLRALGSVALNAGDYGRAKQLYEESLAIRRALGDRWGTANSLQGLGRVALPLGEIEPGERLVREGIAISEEIGDQAGIVKGLGNLGVLLSWSGRFTEAQAVLEKSMAICNDLGFQVGSLYAYAFLSSIKGYLGEYEPARALAQKSLALAREIDHAWGLGYSLMLLGGCALFENDYDRAWQLLQESFSVYREIGQKDTAGLSLALSVVAALRLGRVTLARQYLCEALRMVAAIGAFEQAASALAATALFLAERGQPERAVELYATLSRYLPVTEGGWYKDLFGRHVVAAAAGLPPDAVAAAQARGQERDLEATLAELLIELEDRRWDD